MEGAQEGKLPVVVLRQLGQHRPQARAPIRQAEQLAYEQLGAAAIKVARVAGQFLLGRPAQAFKGQGRAPAQFLLRLLQQGLLPRVDERGAEVEAVGRCARRRQDDLDFTGSQQQLREAFDQPKRNLGRARRRRAIRHARATTPAPSPARSGTAPPRPGSPPDIASRS